MKGIIEFLVKRFVTKGWIDDEILRKQRLLELKKEMDQTGESIETLSAFEQEIVSRQQANTALQNRVVLEIEGYAEDVTVKDAVEEDGGSNRIQREVLEEINKVSPDVEAEKTQQGMNLAQSDRFERASKILRQDLDELSATLAEKEQGRLEAGQVAWESYRDASAEVEAHGFEGGSMHPLIYEGVRTRLTIDRIVQVRQQLAALAER